MIKHLKHIVVLLVLSCQSLEKPPKPEVFIEEDKMVAILTEMASVKAAKTTFRKVLEMHKINPESYILKKHNIDSIVFVKNNVWYTNQSEVYSKLITRVKDSLEASQKKFERLKKEEDSLKRVKEDSIRKAKDTLLSGKEKLDRLKEDLEEQFDEEEEEWVH